MLRSVPQMLADRIRNSHAVAGGGIDLDDLGCPLRCFEPHA